jgi:hypothetical protein
MMIPRRRTNTSSPRYPVLLTTVLIAIGIGFLRAGLNNFSSVHTPSTQTHIDGTPSTATLESDFNLDVGNALNAATVKLDPTTTGRSALQSRDQRDHPQRRRVGSPSSSSTLLSTPMAFTTKASAVATPRRDGAPTDFPSQPHGGGWPSRGIATATAATASPQQLMVVTALSSSHLCALLQLLGTLNESASGTPIIVYDLNPAPGPYIQIDDLRRVYPGVVGVRRFDYSAVPAYFNVLRKAGQWAWKPVIIQEVVDEFGSCLWLDTGAIMLKKRNLATVQGLMRDGEGFYSAPSRGTTYRLVHVGTWLHLGLRKCCNEKDVPPSRQPVAGGACCCCSSQKSWEHRCLKCTTETGGSLSDANMTQWRQVNMCNGAIIGFSREGRAYRDLLLPWVQCAKREDCIAPTKPGSISTRSNHRQDQAALTMLAELRGFKCITRSIEAGFALHKDEIVDHGKCEAILGRAASAHTRVW